MLRNRQEPPRTAHRRMIGVWLCVAALCALVPLLAGETHEERLAKVRRDIRAEYSDVRQIPTTRLDAWLADETRVPPVLLDIREEAEYAVSHMKSARRVDPGKPSTELLRSLASDRTVVVYCSVGKRSCDFAEELRKQGITQVFNLDGGIFQWANEGRPLVDGSQPTDRVHPYDRKWGRLLDKERHSTMKK